MDIIAIILFVRFNVQLAKRKNQDPTLWGVLTVVGYLAAGMPLTFLYLTVVYKAHTPAALLETLIQVSQSPLKSLLIMMFGIGGCLLIRFILERKRTNGPPPSQKRS